MRTVYINEPELLSIELIRVALSERTDELREKATINAKLEIVGFRLAYLSSRFGSDWTEDPESASLVKWVAQSSGARQEASYEFAQTGSRFEQGNERALNVAEQIGKLIVLSIQEGRYGGVQTEEGLLKQVSEQAHELDIRGAKDTDTLRKLWKAYRGIVHLGMAMDHSDELLDPQLNVLHLAEEYRRLLSQSHPKGARDPYVPQHLQTKFIYISELSGPRFQNRGLPFSIV